MRSWLIIACITAIFSQQTLAQDKARELDSIVNHWTALAKFSGTVVVAQKGKKILHNGYGVISHDQGKRPDSNTLFITGGLTEMFTSALVFKLQEEGKLSIKDTLAKYLPEFSFSRQVTLQHLLSHTSGIYDYMKDDSFYVGGIVTPRKREDITRFFNNIRG